MGDQDQAADLLKRAARETLADEDWKLSASALRGLSQLAWDQENWMLADRLVDAALACATEVMSRVDEWNILQVSLPIAIAQVITSARQLQSRIFAGMPDEAVVQAASEDVRQRATGLQERILAVGTGLATENSTLISAWTAETTHRRAEDPKRLRSKSTSAERQSS